MTAHPRTARLRRSARSLGTVKLNITSMMDMFTIILVFLLKSYSTQGQLVTPATGLRLPKSTVERTSREALCVKISQSSVAVEEEVVLATDDYGALLRQQEFMVAKLYDVLIQYADEGRKSAEMFGREFSGEITIQGDEKVPYKVLTRVMYTCGQAGFPIMNLIVYREE